MTTKIWFKWKGIEAIMQEEVQTVVTDSPEEFKEKLGTYVDILKEEVVEAVK